MQAALFSLTLFLSASLVFSVQPLLGKMMLPFVGGSPAGWVVAMAFFQVALLAGYGLAYACSRLNAFTHAASVLALLALGWFFLPVRYDGSLFVPSSGDISGGVVFLQLAVAAGVPFVVLSTLAPALQRVFSYGDSKSAGDPYYLYVASNVGSFFGLFASPLILEPTLGLNSQSALWMGGYALVFALCLVCFVTIFARSRALVRVGLIDGADAARQHSDRELAAAVGWATRLRWLMLAAIPSSLILGITMKITTDIASMPMIWVIPLGLYLLTHIIAFSKRFQPDTLVLAALHILFVGAVFLLVPVSTAGRGDFGASSYLTAAHYVLTFFVTALLLHCCLAASRPATGRLTEFYFFLALGGAIGGGANAFLFPVIFDDVYEFYAVLLLSLAFNPLLLRGGNARKISLRLGAALAFFIISAAVTFSFMPDHLHQARNFFGVVKVFEGEHKPGDPATMTRYFMHGTTIHGIQPKDPAYALKPSAYFTEAGPVGDVFAIMDPGEVGVLGLGAGQMSCYRRPGRNFTYYEIDPHVVETAKAWFSFLSECGYKSIVVGDGRLKLRDSSDRYDVLFMDAFTSDAIPVHLVTTEAVQLYFERIREGGIVVFNISNNHIDLRRTIASIAESLGAIPLVRLYKPGPERAYEFASIFMVVTRDEETARQFEARGWKRVEGGQRPWTDDYSNLLGALRMFK